MQFVAYVCRCACSASVVYSDIFLFVTIISRNALFNVEHVKNKFWVGLLRGARETSSLHHLRIASLNPDNAIAACNQEARRAKLSTLSG